MEFAFSTASIGPYGSTTKELDTLILDLAGLPIESDGA
jgi:hypothetical protein